MKKDEDTVEKTKSVHTSILASTHELGWYISPYSSKKRRTIDNVAMDINTGEASQTLASSSTIVRRGTAIDIFVLGSI